MTRSSIVWKLVLAFLVVALTATAIVALAIRMTSADRLTELIIDQQRSNLQAPLESYYQTYGSWDGIQERWRSIQFQQLPSEINPTLAARIQAAATPMPRKIIIVPLPGRAGESDRRNLFGLADSQGNVIIATDPKFPPGSQAANKDLKSGAALIVGGEKVGTILTARLSPRFNPEEYLFLQRTNSALFYAAIGAMLIALIIGVILARELIRPLNSLTQAAQNIARGQLDQQVKVGSTDEIGQLAVAFNFMSQEVMRVNQQRKQMTADIAHDLRTPLTVIAGYVESMRDGVLRPTPERLSLIYTEIERLQELVHDLRMLSQVDAGELPLHPEPVAPRVLLEQAAAPFQHRAEQQNVQLAIEAGTDLPELEVDEGRMMQVFGNLLTNSLRYTPDGGKVTLSAAETNGAVVLAVEDNGSGIAGEDLPFIFDRFQRADKSRHSETGESGLGLAIVKALIEAHGGTVRAISVRGQGTRIEMILPPRH